MYSIKYLCYKLKCSRSGYYDWVSLGKPKHKAYNETINKVILEQYLKDKKQGIERLQMNIKKVHGLILTRYSVYRYMKLNQIQSMIRKKRYKWGTKPHMNIPNLLKRNFTTNKPNQKWSIDISYLFCKERVIYICAIKDLFDKSIISYKISRFINNTLVNDTVQLAIDSIPINERKELILHSDQGGQFTNPTYAEMLRKNQIKHSVSFRGSCVDNCPIESWFSALKIECIYLEDKMSESEMIYKVEGYIKYYNEERLQKKIKELAPIEYRKQALSRFFI